MRPTWNFRIVQARDWSSAIWVDHEAAKGKVAFIFGRRAAYSLLSGVVALAAGLSTDLWAPALGAERFASLVTTLTVLALLVSCGLFTWNLVEFWKRSSLTAFHRVDVDARGIRIGAFQYASPIEEDLLEAVGTPMDVAHRTLAFVDIAGIGHDVRSIWLELDDGERVVLPGQPTPHGVERLRDLIRPYWVARRGGLVDDREGAKRSASQLAKLKDRS